MVYDGRPARVLFSGSKVAAQSGIALDDKSDLLFDYNQRFMELTLALKPQKILLVGGGAYTFPTALLSVLPATSIDVVEIDEGLDEIAARFFGLDTGNPRLNIIHEDGYAYMATHRRRYDLILIDAFTQTAIPPDLISEEAGSSMYHNLKRKGVLAMNIIASYYGHNSMMLREVVAHWSHYFKAVTIYPADMNVPLWLPQNFVLVAQKGRERTLPLRFAPLKPLQP